MRSRQIGATFWDFLIFVLLVAVAAVGVNYFLHKPTVIAPAPIVVQNVVTPPPLMKETPPTRPADPVVVAPLPPEPKLVVAAYVPQPDKPACVIIEEKLRTQEAVLAQARKDIAAAKNSCLKRLGESTDYSEAKEDLTDKMHAKDAAADQLSKDIRLGLDTDQDARDRRAATQDWIAAVAKVTAMENDALAADPGVGEKSRIYKGASTEVARLQGELSDYIAKTIKEDADSDDCPLGIVKLDAQSWTVHAEMTPAKQASAGAMADAAMSEIGRILQGTMCRSPFSWDTARFTIYGDYKGKKAVEFQAIYLRSAVDQAKWRKTSGDYFDDQGLVNLAKGFWVSPVVEQMQGGKVAHPKGESSPNGQKWMMLTIGGYARADGSMCPVIYVRCPVEEERASSFTAIIPGRAPMLPLYGDRPLDPMGPALDLSRP